MQLLEFSDKTLTEVEVAAHDQQSRIHCWHGCYHTLLEVNEQGMRLHSVFRVLGNTSNLTLKKNID